MPPQFESLLREGRVHKVLQRPLASPRGELGTFLGKGAQLLEGHAERFIIRGDLPGWPDDRFGDSSLHHDGNYPARHRLDQDDRPFLRTFRPWPGCKHQTVDITPERINLRPGHTPQPAHPRGEAQPLRKEFEALLFRSGSSNREGPASHDRGAGAQEHVYAAIREKTSHVGDAKGVVWGALERRGQRYAGLRHGGTGSPRELLPETLQSHGVSTDSATSCSEGPGLAPPGPEPGDRAIRLTEHHDRDVEARRLPSRHRGSLGTRLLLDLNDVGPKVGEEPAEGAAVPLERLGQITIAAERNRHNPHAAILGRHPTWHRRGHRHAEAGEGAEFASPLGMEIEMRNNDRAHRRELTNFGRRLLQHHPGGGGAPGALLAVRPGGRYSKYSIRRMTPDVPFEFDWLAPGPALPRSFRTALYLFLGGAATGCFIPKEAQFDADLVRQIFVIPGASTSVTKYWLYRGGEWVEIEFEDIPLSAKWATIETYVTGPSTTISVTAPTAQVPETTKVALFAGGRVPGGATASTRAALGQAGQTLVPGLNMIAARIEHGMAPLAGQRVLIAGGFGPGFPIPVLASAEIFTLSSRTFAATGSMGVGRGHGKRSAEVYTPATNSFTPVGDMSVVHGLGHVVVKLPSGKVAVIGGDLGNINPTGAIEVFDPATNLFTTVATMNPPRQLQPVDQPTDVRRQPAG